MAPYIPSKPITRANSTKANPHALSFLDLPAEIRNQIYGYFFKASTSIRIRSWSHGHLSFLGDYTYPGSKRNIRGRFLDVKGVLSVCRQVYYEAATMLLTVNTWAVHGVHNDGNITHLREAGSFLGTLGSRSSMLSKPIVDFCGICSMKCYHDSSWHFPPDPVFDTTSAIGCKELVRELSKSSNKGIDLELVFSIPEYFTGSSSTALAESGLDLFRLRNFLRTLVQDPLEFLQYGNQACEVLVARDGMIGCVVFGHSLQKWTHKQYFCASDNGSVLLPIPSEISSSILQFPSNIQRQIFDLVTIGTRSDPYVPDVATFNLDKRTCMGLSPVLLSVCQDLRRDYFDLFWETNSITTIMTSTSKRADFDAFSQLEKLWCTSRSARHPWSLEPREGLGAVEFLLQFEVEPNNTLESLRINIIDFLRITSYMTRRQTQLNICIVGGKGGDGATTPVYLHALRCYALIGLSEFLRKYPEAERKLCPKVWINGLGQIIEVETLDTTMNVEKYVQEYTPSWNHHSTIFQNYGVPYISPDLTAPTRAWHERYIPSGPVEAFDGSLYFYLGYLQRFSYQNSTKFWADYYFQFPDA